MGGRRERMKGPPTGEKSMPPICAISSRIATDAMSGAFRREIGSTHGVKSEMIDRGILAGPSRSHFFDVFAMQYRARLDRSNNLPSVTAGLALKSVSSSSLFSEMTSTLSERFTTKVPLRRVTT